MKGEFLAVEATLASTIFCRSLLKTSISFDRGWWRTWESSQPDLYMKRYQAIVEFIAKQPTLDAICLQEFWFNDDAMDFFESKLGEK